MTPWQELAPALLLVALTLLVYLPALRAGWIWDDKQYVWDNPGVVSADGLRAIWFDPGASQQYYPLVFTIFWLQYRLWGANPIGYHLVNVLFHAANAALLWRLLRRMHVPGAWLGAAIFALHPVHVESVAWVTELKNLASGCFCLLAASRWWRFLEARQPRDYALTGALFVCALLSKTAAAPLPVVLFLLACWRSPVEWRRAVTWVVPLLILALGFGWVTVRQEPADIQRTLTAPEQVVVAGRALWFYAGKLLWPTPLMTIYPLWQIDASVPTQYLPAVAAAAVVASLWWLRGRIGSGPLVAVLSFTIGLLPVLGFISFSFMLASYVADHFQYLPSMAMIALLAAMAVRVSGRLQVTDYWARSAAAGCLLLLGVLSWRQQANYKDGETLWRAAVAQNPQAWMAQWGLGQRLQEQGRNDEALDRFAAAAGLEPGYPPIYVSWGETLAAQDKFDDAIAKYEKALSLHPKQMMAQFDLGTALFRQGKFPQAGEHLAAAVRLAPDAPALRLAFGTALVKQGKLDDAVAEFAAALRIKPDYVDAHDNWAAVLLMQGKRDEAIEHLRAAVRLDPGDKAARTVLEGAVPEAAVPGGATD